jgi:hypothetical protein
MVLNFKEENNKMQKISTHHKIINHQIFTDKVRREKDKYKFMVTDMDATFTEMAGF